MSVREGGLCGGRSAAATMACMRLADKTLVHQVHPVKISADVTASIVSNVLLWRGQVTTAITVRVVLPMAGSAAVLGMADLDSLGRTRRGRYVLEHMPPAAQAVRLAGDAVMGWGAGRRSRALLLIGAGVIVVGWSHALWPRALARHGQPWA
jgi:hypothetical protein